MVEDYLIDSDANFNQLQSLKFQADCAANGEETAQLQTQKHDIKLIAQEALGETIERWIGTTVPKVNTTPIN